MIKPTFPDFKTLRQMAVIIIAGGLFAVAINVLHPKPIPWVQDWSNYVESKAQTAGIEVIPLRRALELQKDGSLFVDARSSSDFAIEHVSGAWSLPFEELDLRFETVMKVLDVDQPLVIYCHNRECDDALMLAIELRDLGQSNLMYFVDGFDVWKDAGCPTE